MDEDALAFEQASDVLAADDAEDKSIVHRNGDWNFIRSEWFGDGEGYVVSTDGDGRIEAVLHDYYIAMDGEDGEGDEDGVFDEPFDASLVDWTMYRLEPETDWFTSIEGEGVSVGLGIVHK